MAENQYEKKKEKEIMENIFASLNKKDSLRVLLEAYEDSLHRADHISDSPRDNQVFEEWV